MVVRPIASESLVATVSLCLTVVATSGCGRIAYDVLAGGSSDMFDSGSADARVDTDSDVNASPGDGSPANDAEVLSCATLASGAFFCDDFESPNLARWDETVTSNGTVQKTNAEHRKGSGALLAQGGDPAEASTAFVRKTFAAISSGDLWVRAYARMPSGYGAVELYSMAVGSASQRTSVSVFADGKLYLRSSPGGYGANASANLSLDTWSCLQLRVRPSDSGGEVELFLDDQSVALGTGWDTLPPGGLDRIELGLVLTYRFTGPVPIYFDDVVVSTSRVPCQ